MPQVRDEEQSVHERRGLPLIHMFDHERLSGGEVQAESGLRFILIAEKDDTQRQFRSGKPAQPSRRIVAADIENPNLHWRNPDDADVPAPQLVQVLVDALRRVAPLEVVRISWESHASIPLKPLRLRVDLSPRPAQHGVVIRHSHHQGVLRFTRDPKDIADRKSTSAVDLLVEH